MKNRNRLIVALLCVGAVMMTIVLLYARNDNDKQSKYKKEQLNAVTCDINNILPYKNQYMGNSANISNLFYHLPLSESNMKFQLFANELKVKVSYEHTIQQAGKANLKYTNYALEGTKEIIENYYITEVKKSLIYNSTAAFGLIANLNAIEYEFADQTYTVYRHNVESLYPDFSNILNEDNWQTQVQRPLENETYIDSVADQILKTE